MPGISKRAVSAHVSPIRKLSPFAEQAKKAGKKVYHLNIGQPDIETPQAAIRRLQETPVDILAYSPSYGIPSYRNKLPQYYQHFGVELSPEDILVTNGASEGVFFTFLACLDPGESVLTTEPFYANYQGFADMAGVNIRPVTSDIADGFALPGIAAFRKAITSDTKAILLCNPNNPTGCVYPEAMLRTLGEIVLEFDLYLIVDEVYREFCYGDTPFFSALNLPGLEKHVIIIDSVSKRYSACGARVGAIVTRNEAVLRNVLKYAEMRLSPPSYGQMLAEYLLDTDEAYFETVSAEYQRRRDLLYKRLSAMPDVICYRPDGAFYVFAALPIDDSDRFCRWLLEEFSWHNQTVMLAPGTGFYATSGLGRQEVRFAYVLNENDLDCAMDVLEKALEMYPGRLRAETEAVSIAG